MIKFSFVKHIVMTRTIEKFADYLFFLERFRKNTGISLFTI